MKRGGHAQARRGPDAGTRDLVRVAAFTLGLFALVQAIGSLLAQHRAAAASAQAFAAEWGAGRLGLAWSDPMAPPPNARASARRALYGCAVGLAAAAATLAFAAATRAVLVDLRAPAAADIASGALVALLASVRDELVLRGLVLRAARHAMSPRARVAVCAAVAACARLGQVDGGSQGTLFGSGSSATAASVACAALAAVPLSLLWLRERGAWSACGAHAAWTFGTTTVAGSVLDARWAQSLWGGRGGALGLEGSLAAVVLLGCVAAVTVALGERFAPPRERVTMRDDR